MPPQPPKGLKAVYGTAVGLVVVLVGLLVVGSLYAVVRPANSGPLFRLGARSDASVSGFPGGGVPVDATHDNIFTGIGRLRIPLAGQPAATVVLSMSFPYPAGDMAFAEELAPRVGEFRSIAVAYFASFSRAGITAFDETAAKAEILSRYNAMLHLGRIEELFFTDLVILD